MMSSNTNDIRSNIIFLLYKIYALCLQHKLESVEWKHESFIFTWDGKQTLKLEKSIVLATVKEEDVILSPTIMEYYHLPYSWLREIQKSLEMRIKNSKEAIEINN